VKGAAQEVTHPVRAPAVGRDAVLGVEHDGVDDVGLGADASDVLLERGEVVEQQRRRRDRGQASGQHLAAPLSLFEDRAPLPVLDDGEDRAHGERGDHERPRQQSGLQ
jgi:hypothetical protein